MNKMVTTLVALTAFFISPIIKSESDQNRKKSSWREQTCIENRPILGKPLILSDDKKRKQFLFNHGERGKV